MWIYFPLIYYYLDDLDDLDASPLVGTLDKPEVRKLREHGIKESPRVFNILWLITYLLSSIHGTFCSLGGCSMVESMKPHRDKSVDVVEKCVDQQGD